MQKILLILLLSLSACKYPDVELKFLIPEDGVARIFQSPKGDGTEWEDTGREIPIDTMSDHYCLSAEDFQKFVRYYQRLSCSDTN